MSSTARSDLGFGAALDNLDSFDAVKKPSPKPAADPVGTKVAAEAAGFRSREPNPQKTPAPKAASKPVRRRRTGRNAQFNLKAKPETIDAFCAVADANDWGLGETLEYAVELLQAKYGAGQGRQRRSG